MIRWVAWFFAAPWLFLLDGVLAGLVPVRVDLALAVCLVFALESRAPALPGLLFCTALARTLFAAGDLPLHFLVLGLPVAALLPLRAVVVRRSLVWRVTAAGFLAVTMPRLHALLAALTGQPADVAPVAAEGVVVQMAAVPFAAWLLGRLPPLSAFREASE